jgi:hypothetical protein
MASQRLEKVSPVDLRLTWWTVLKYGDHAYPYVNLGYVCTC